MKKQVNSEEFLMGVLVGYLPHSGVVQFLECKTGLTIVGKVKAIQKHHCDLSLGNQSVVYKEDIDIWFTRSVECNKIINYQSEMCAYQDHFNSLNSVVMSEYSKIPDEIDIDWGEIQYIQGYVIGCIPVLNLFEVIDNNEDLNILDIKVKPESYACHNIVLFNTSRFSKEYIEEVANIGNVYSLFEELNKKDIKELMQYTRIQSGINWISAVVK